MQASLVLLAAAMVAVSSQAQAACNPPSGSAPPGTVVTCTGTTTNQDAPNGYGTGTQTGITVNVQSGASVTGTTAGISLGSSNSVSNLGSLTATNGAGFAEGINTGVSSSVINSGTMTAIATGYAETINMGGGNNTVINSGTMIATSSGSFAETINMPGGGNVTNSGTMTATSTASFAIAINFPGNGTIVNSGTVNALSTASLARGIKLAGIGTVVNLGVVSASSPTSAQGILLGSSNSSLINAGAVSAIGPGAAAIQLASSDTLTLLPGSFIIGGLQFTGTNNTVVLNVGNQNLTFNSLAGTTVTGNLPFVVKGNEIVSVDPTGFAMQGRVLNDFTREVSSSIPQIAGSAAAGGAPLAFAAPDASARIEDAFASIPGLAAYSGDAMVFKNPTVIYSDGSAVWARGFAGNRVQPGDGTLLHANSQLYGGMIGGDMRLHPDLRLGAFLGVGNSRFGIDQTFTGAGANFGNGSSDLIFGGLYAQYDAGATFLRAALQGGGSHNFNTRNINNNLLAGGLETATASFNGLYVSPEATVGHRVALGQLADASYTLTPSLRLRYLYGSYDGYTETGTTTAPLTIGSRSVSTMEERGELKLTRTVTFTPSSQLSMSAYGGVLGTQRAGDSTINAALFGQPFPFASPGPASVWGGIGGGGLEWRTRNVTVFSAAEYLGLSDSSTVVSGRAGLRVSF